MSKKFKLIIATVVVVAVVLFAFAGSALAAGPAWVAGSHSNFVGGPHDVNAEDPCSVCHVTHGAAQTRYLWAEVAGAVTWPAGTPSWPASWNATDWNNGAVSSSELRSSDIYLLCYSCHDGTGMGELQLGSATLGASTAFDLTKGMHRMRSSTFQQAPVTEGGKGSTLLASYGRDCDRCHDPHEDTSVRPNFIRYYRVGGTSTTLTLGPNICAGCHAGELASDTNHSHWVATYPTNNHGTVANATSQGLPINPAMVVLNPMAGGSSFGTRLFNAALESVNNYQNSGVENGGHRLGLATLDGTGNWPGTATMKCESCHAPHGGAPITGATSAFNGTEFTDGWKNLTINTMNPAAGALCTNCHF